MPPWFVAVIASAILTYGTDAIAQDSRAQEIAAAQAEKARQLSPHVPHPAEQLLLTVRQSLIEAPAGFYPYFDSVYSGGGFTLGGGYRRFTGDRTHVSVAGLYSAKNYKLGNLGVASTGHLSGRLDLRADAGWRDATQVAFHGLGIDSPAEGAAYRMQQTYAGGDVTLRPLRYLRLTAGAAHESYVIKDPLGDDPAVDALFDPVSAPGSGVNPTYLHTTAAAAFDWRPGDDYARRGGLYRVARHHYADRDDAFTFDRLDADLVQHVPILRENWVISLRGRLQTTLGDGDAVPYFMLPSLGSGSTLRGYSSWRFRDRHAALVSAEWRWIANRLGLDMAVFYDAGMVAPELDALALRSFVDNVGIGARFHGPVRTPLRIELAHGSEGARLVFAASAAF
jgi:hypothetical protein